MKIKQIIKPSLILFIILSGAVLAVESWYTPIKDSNTSETIGYIITPQGVATQSSVKINPILASASTLELMVLPNGTEAIILNQTLGIGYLPPGCPGYKVGVTVNEYGKVQTEYIGVGCAYKDPTHQNNIAFASGTKVQVEPSTAQERNEHGNAEVVIINDINLPIDTPLVLGDK